MESAIAKWTLYDPYLSNLACNCPDDAAAADLLLSWQPVKLRTQEALRNHRVTKRAWAGCPLYLCTKVTDILRAVYPNDYWAPAPLDHPNRCPRTRACSSPGCALAGWLRCAMRLQTIIICCPIIISRRTESILIIVVFRFAVQCQIRVLCRGPRHLLQRAEAVRDARRAASRWSRAVGIR